MVYEEYHKKQVRIILDARTSRHIWRSGAAGTSLDLTATIVGETGTHLDLEQISNNTAGVLDRKKDNETFHGKFKKARVDKSYVIGVFEE